MCDYVFPLLFRMLHLWRWVLLCSLLVRILSCITLNWFLSVSIVSCANTLWLSLRRRIRKCSLMYLLTHAFWTMHSFSCWFIDRCIYYRFTWWLMHPSTLKFVLGCVSFLFAMCLSFLCMFVFLHLSASLVLVMSAWCLVLCRCWRCQLLGIWVFISSFFCFVWG